MIRLFAIFVLVSFSIFVFGDREDSLNSLRATYVDQDKIRDLYLKLKREQIEPGLMNPCATNGPTIFEGTRQRNDWFDFKSEVITGDFKNDSGYRLVLDDLTTIDIPAIIKCTTKLKPNMTTHYGLLNFVFFLVLHGNENDLQYDKALVSKTRTEEKSVFILTAVEMVEQLLQTWNNDRPEKRAVIKWFKNQKQQRDVMVHCMKLINLRIHDKETLSKWTPVRGKIENSPYILKVTDNIQLTLRGTISCVFYVDDSCATQTNGHEETLYFTLAKVGQKGGEGNVYVPLIGPKMDGKTRIFSLRETLL